VQGREEKRAREIAEGAAALEEAGAFAVVLESVPAPLAGEITASLNIPTIGIGAGPSCDGQVLVLHDLLGLYREFTPSFVKRYADLGNAAQKAVEEFCTEVRGGKFPDEKYFVN
jgi:3-methyl-2-oxobutanoate hydroxymethyltransferase